MEYHPQANLQSSTDNTSKPWYYQHPYTRHHPLILPSKYLTATQVQEFHNDGVLIIKSEDIWNEGELQDIIEGTNKMDDWPDCAGKWMKYYEKAKNGNTNIDTDIDTQAHQGNEEKRQENENNRVNHNNYVASRSDAKMVQRIENFCEYNSTLDSILRGEKMLGMCSELFGEESILYKEKVNYKLPGGEGFAPHQDVCAGWWMYNQDLHISVLICIDEATLENGCLEIVRKHHTDGMLSQEYKEVNPDFVKHAKWEYVTTKPGDVVFFDSYVPHRSAPNLSNNKRRVLYSTYAKKSQGDYRDRYYADKRISFPPDIERVEGKKYEYKI